jgi:hypothetical protein
MSHVIEYMANILSSLLTPMGYFEMSDDKRWKVYKNETENENPSPDILAKGMQTWASLTDNGIVEARTMTTNILSEDFMTALDQVIGKDAMESMWFKVHGDDYMMYCEEVNRLFGQFVYAKPFEQPEAREVRDQWRRKWEFVTHDQSEDYFQKPLMLLTPSSVETLAAALGRVREATSEVSIVYLSVYCMLRRKTDSVCAETMTLSAPTDGLCLRT